MRLSVSDLVSEMFEIFSDALFSSIRWSHEPRRSDKLMSVMVWGELMVSHSHGRSWDWGDCSRLVCSRFLCSRLLWFQVVDTSIDHRSIFCGVGDWDDIIVCDDGWIHEACQDEATDVQAADVQVAVAELIVTGSLGKRSPRSISMMGGFVIVVWESLLVDKMISCRNIKILLYHTDCIKIYQNSYGLLS